MYAEQIGQNRSFGGWHKRYRHRSESLKCDMEFAIYLPPQTSRGRRVPVLYWLSGLTCTDENFMQKAGAQRIAAELGIAIVAPDTSPRGDGVADDWDKYYLGQGAGYYINAVREPWASHYRMYDYVVEELPALIEKTFPVTDQRCIAGHSMGGHGALTVALKNPERYSSVSAFSPICNPVNCGWGQTAFKAYLGDNRESWREHDASVLMSWFGGDADPVPALVDQGEADEFIDTQLMPEMLEAAAQSSRYPLEMRRHEGYDHSYYFVSSFIESHLRFHALHLGLIRPF